MKCLRMMGLTFIFMVATIQSGWAFFDFGANSSLCISFYKVGGNKEKGYDLGTFGTGGSIDLTAQNVSLAPAGTVLPSIVGATNGVNVKVGVWSTTSDWEFVFGITATDEPGISIAGMAPSQNAMRQVMYSGYQYNAEGERYVLLTDIGVPPANDYATRLSDGYGSLTDSWSSGWEATLAGLTDGTGKVDIYLYWTELDLINYEVVFNKGADPATDYAAVLRIMEDGSVWLNPTDDSSDPQLSDAIAILQIIAGLDAAATNWIGDEPASGGVIDIADVIYVLQVLGGLRQAD